MGLFNDLLNKFSRKKAAASTVPAATPAPVQPSAPAAPAPSYQAPPTGNAWASANKPAPAPANPWTSSAGASTPPPAEPRGFMRGDATAAARGYAQAQATPPVQPTGPVPGGQGAAALPEGDIKARIAARTAAPSAEELAARNARAESYMRGKTPPAPVAAPAASPAARPGAAASRPAVGAAAATAGGRVAKAAGTAGRGLMRGAGAVAPLIMGGMEAKSDLEREGKVTDLTKGRLAADSAASGIGLFGGPVGAGGAAVYSVLRNPTIAAADRMGEKTGAQKEDIRSDYLKAKEAERGVNSADMVAGAPAASLHDQTVAGQASLAGNNAITQAMKARQAAAQEEDRARSGGLMTLTDLQKQAAAGQVQTEQTPPAVSDEERVTADQVAAERAAPVPEAAPAERGFFMRPAPESQEERAVRLTEEGRQKRLVTQASANAKGTALRREGESFMRERRDDVLAERGRREAGAVRNDLNRNLSEDRTLALNLGALESAGLMAGAQAKSEAEARRMQADLAKTLADAQGRIQEAQVNAQGEQAKQRIVAAGEAFKARLAAGVPVVDEDGQPIFDKTKDGKRIQRMRQMTGPEQAQAWQEFQQQAGLAGGASQRGALRVGATAVNKQTGERMQWNGTAWVPVAAAATAGV